MSTKPESVRKPLPANMAAAALEDVRAMRRGELRGRVHFPQDAIDVPAIRQRLGLTQAEFAERFSLNLHSVVQWEQGKRQPEGAAKVLLALIAADHKAVERLVKKAGLAA